MPKLPTDADLGLTPMNPPGGNIRAARRPMPPDSVAVAGAGKAAIVRALGEVGGDIATVAVREKEHADDVRVEDAFNQLRQKQIDLSYGDENGFTKLKGGDAANTPVLKQWGTKFEDARKGIDETLTNQRQKDRFKQRADIAQQDFSGDILRYVDQQKTVYRKEVYKGTIDTETKSAIASWDDGNAIQLSLTRIENAVNQEAKAQGLNPDRPQDKAQIDAMRMHAVTTLHAGVIGQALENKDPVYAQAYYKTVAEQLDPAVHHTVGKAVSDGVQKQLATDYQGQFVDSRDDVKSLRDLEKRVAADGTLDEDRRNILLGRTGARIDLLEAKQEREQTKLVNDLRKKIEQVNRITLAGYEPTAEQMLPLVQEAKGTELEGDVRQMVVTANATKAFRSQTPQQQEATITQIETAARKDPTKFDVSVIDHFKRIHAAQQEQLKSDPITFAQRQGLLDQNDVAAQPIDFSKPETWSAQLGARYDLARGMASHYQAPVKPLTTEEKDVLVDTLRKMPVGQKSGWLAQLANASGSDFDGYKALMAQISPDDPVTAHAGIMAGRGRIANDAGFSPEPGQAINVSNMILQGQAILHPNRKEDGQPDKGKLWPMPKDEDMAKTFQGYERDAFAGRPEARNGFLQTAKAIYAFKTAEVGDSSGVLDSSLWEDSIKLATGGIERWNGKSLVMPWGYSRGQFKDELYRRIDDMVQSDRLAPGVNAGKLRDMPLESIGDGRYLFRAGDGLLVDKAGQPLTIDFNNSAAFRPSGFGLEGNRSTTLSGINTEKKRNPKPSDLVRPGGMAGVRG